ncbi:FAD-dependent oxidoreductase [Nocardioides marmoriginsengisoli]|uniref:FAD-dependent oxidoreductase n=1 Tax=Nocardioides marmoriginsengisoli TaxID=661483 RepID=A0A3N0CIX5_9ACTN|nr:FAD-dependent oxidoreductase [Nocardioides marmoriginsengisoli]RNL63221.1 FAD-dependent oxidoreductase [Nocardioides marmoriginsengisoli]
MSSTHSSLRGAAPTPYWLDDGSRPDAAPPLVGDTSADLVVVGGGYLGLWTALLAVTREPGRDVLLLEGETCGHAASGRNGGFCEASLTHGFGNGLSRWPEELATLVRLGRENLDAIGTTIADEGIDCDFVRAGALSVATLPEQVAGLADEQAEAVEHDSRLTLLDAAAVRARVDSPTYLGALHDPDSAILEPARLAWGLREACLRRGVRIHEGTPVSGLRRLPHGTVRGRVEVRTSGGSVVARRVMLATNAFRPLLRRLRLMTVPVYDYALMTAPLSTEQRAAIGWPGREGIGDRTNRFHYYRTTRDGRILWGGYDAIYHYGSRQGPAYDQRPETFDVLAEHFFATFPQLEGLPFTHSWGGVIDTCTRFTAFHGTAYDGQVAYALGFTGLGVAATRFAAEVALDQLAGEETERTSLRMVREKPLPFPPEPVRWAGIGLTTWSLARADANGGKENLWLKTMDRLGLGFDS